MAHETITVKLGFDPWANEATQEIFSDGFTRKFYLLWRRDHLVSDLFNEACLKLMRKWKKARPATNQEMIDSMTEDGIDFSIEDIRNFVHKYEGYLFSDGRVGFQLNTMVGRTQG